jgi:hypothetical protein
LLHIVLVVSAFFHTSYYTPKNQYIKCAPKYIVPRVITIQPSVSIQPCLIHPPLHRYQTILDTVARHVQHGIPCGV